MSIHKNIKELTEGTAVDGFYLLRDANLFSTSSGRPYLSAVVSDASGDMALKVWDYKGSILSSDAGRIVCITGAVGSYRGKLQITAEQICIAEEGWVSSDELACIIPVAPIVVEEYEVKLRNYISSICDRNIYDICNYLIRKYESQFLKIPAGKSVHHNFRYGLLMHTVNMCQLADCIAEEYSDIVNRDLLIAGVVLHDIGKVREFKISDVTGLVNEYSLEGNLLGHACIGAQEIAEAAEAVKADNYTAVMLQHLMLSHHGSPDFGSARIPQMIEAELLHCIDMIDSRTEIYAENLNSVPYDDYSAYIHSIEKRIFRHHLDLVCEPRPKEQSF